MQAKTTSVNVSKELGSTVAGTLQSGRFVDVGAQVSGQLESALANYREMVTVAFNAIEVSIGNIELLAAPGLVAVRDPGRAEEAFHILEVGYREGVAKFQKALVSQSALYNAPNSLSDNKLAQLNAIVAIDRSLGGGWQQG